MAEPAERFRSFASFYPYYLAEHRNLTCRRLHFLGTTLMLGVFVSAIALGRLAWLWAIPVVGYGPAWVGHFFFEHNRPATFKYPFYSLAGDFLMYWQMLTRRIKW